MATKIGPFILQGTDVQNASIAAMAKKMGDVLGPRLSNVSVVFLPGDQMPPRSDGGPSVGYTPNPHKIKMWRAIRKYKVAETFAHEAIHALDGQWFNWQQRQDILALETPAGAKWDPKGYANDGAETAARCGSGALFGIANPPYKSFYSHDIPVASWPNLAKIMLASYGVPVAIPIEPQPTPAIPKTLQEQVDDLEQINAGLEIRIEDLQRQLDECKGG